MVGRMKTCVPTKIRLSDPAELVAALPYLVGFFPRDSLVVVCLHGPRPRIGLVVRVDLPPPGQERALARSLLAPVVTTRPSSVVLVVVGGGRPHPVLGFPAAAAVATVAGALDEHGVPTRQRMWVEALQENARWSCYERCCGGRLPTPQASPVAAAAAVAGQVTFADREELRRLVAPDGGDVLARRGALLDGAVVELDRELAQDPGAVLRRHLAVVRDAVEAATRGELPATDDQVVALALALADRSVRDWCLRWCRGDRSGAAGDDRAAAAEQLWLALTRATPPPESANPATLAGLTAYLRGNGALAGMALDCALQAWPGHDLATLLAAALDAGLPPSSLARLVDEAADDAELTMIEDTDEPVATDR